MLGLNRQLDFLGRHRIDHFVTLDDGTGKFINDTAFHIGDGLHPNDAGYAVLFDAIDIGIFTHGSAGRFVDADRGAAWRVRADTPNGNGILINAASGLLKFPRSLTMRIRVKPPASGALGSRAFMCAYAEGDIGAQPIRFRNAGGPYDLGDGGSATLGTSTFNPGNDQTTRDLVVVVNAAANKIRAYVDAVQFVDAAPQVALTPCKLFSFLARGESTNAAQATSYTGADFAVWTVALGPAAIADMFRTNRLPPASMIFRANLAGSPGVGGMVPNGVANGLSATINEATFEAVPNI